MTLGRLALRRAGDARCSIVAERGRCRHRTRLPRERRAPATRGGTVPMLTIARHPARVACVPEGVRRASPGCLPRRSLPSRPRGSGRALAARGQPRVSTAHGRHDRRYCKGKGKGPPWTDRDGPAEYNRIGFLGPSLGAVSPNSRYLAFYELQRPGRVPSVLTAPTLTRRASDRYGLDPPAPTGSEPSSPALALADAADERSGPPWRLG